MKYTILLLSVLLLTAVAVNECDTTAAWSSTATYGLNDKVLFKGDIYVSTGTCVNSSPEFNTVWQYVTECTPDVTTTPIPPPSTVAAVCVGAPTWNENELYAVGTIVLYPGGTSTTSHAYKVTSANRCSVPGYGSPWEDLGCCNCGTDACSSPAYNPNQSYIGGSKVVHNGRAWSTPTWISQGQEPGSYDWNTWTNLKWCITPPPCDCSSAKYTHYNVYFVGDCVRVGGSVFTKVYKAIQRNTCLDPGVNLGSYWELVRSDCPADTTPTDGGYTPPPSGGGGSTTPTYPATGCDTIPAWISYGQYAVDYRVVHQNKRWKLISGSGYETPGSVLVGQWQFEELCVAPTCTCSAAAQYVTGTNYYPGECINYNNNVNTVITQTNQSPVQAPTSWTTGTSCGGGSCSGIQDWVSKTYTAGTQVIYQGKKWQLAWGDGKNAPTKDLWGYWTFLSQCSTDLCDCTATIWTSTKNYYPGDCSTKGDFAWTAVNKNAASDPNPGWENSNWSKTKSCKAAPSGNCGVYYDWVSGTRYRLGDRVAYQGFVWEAQWDNNEVTAVAPGVECWGAFNRVEPCVPTGPASCESKPAQWNFQACYYTGDKVLTADGNIYVAKDRNICNYPEYDNGHWDFALDCTPLDNPTTCATCVAWQGPVEYRKGDYVCHNGKLWRATVANVCQNPDWCVDTWEFIKNCSDVEPDPETPPTPTNCLNTAQWRSTTQYYQGDRVLFGYDLWEARNYNKNSEPIDAYCDWVKITRCITPNPHNVTISGNCGNNSPSNPILVENDSGFSVLFSAAVTPAGCYVDTVSRNNQIIRDRVVKQATELINLNSVTETTMLSAVCVCPPQTKTITPSQGPDCALAPMSPQVVNVGGSSTFTLGAGTNQYGNCWVDGLSLNGVAQTGTIPASYTFSNVQADQTIHITCSCPPPPPPAPKTITSSVLDSNCNISPMGQVTVQNGAGQTYTFWANTGCSVSAVKVDSVATTNYFLNIAGQFEYSFTGVNADHTIAVGCYCPPPPEYTITPSSANPSNCVISPATPVTVTQGQSTSFHFNPQGQYCVVQTVKVDNIAVQGVPNNSIGGFDYNFSNVQSDHTISIACDCTPPNHDITASASGPGCYISPPGTTTVVEGSSSSFSYGSTQSNCQVSQLKVDGVNQNCAREVCTYTYTASSGSIRSYAFETRTSQKTARIYVQTAGDANSFTLAVNNGPNPKGYGGEMALFYFDCASTNAPRVTVYTYNGENSSTSWKKYKTGATVADFIVSSANNVGPGKTFADVQCGRLANGNTEYRIDIADGSVILNHVPLLTDPQQQWTGYDFDTLHGVWLHSYDNCQVTYDSNNKITQWAYSSEGWVDKSNAPAVCLNQCNSPYTFQNVVADHTIQATCGCEPVFPAPTYVIQSSLLTANCTITPKGNYIFAQGASKTYNFAGATSNCTVNALKVDGSTVTLSSGQTSYTFSSISADHTIAVGCNCVFPPPPPPPEYDITTTITVNAHSSKCSITPGSAHVVQGGSASFAFAAQSGCQVQSVTSDGSPASTTSLTYTNITANHAIVLTCYCPPPPEYTITSSATGQSCSITPSGSTTVVQGNGASYLFKSTPVTNMNCQVDRYLIDGVAQTDLASLWSASQNGFAYSFSNVAANHQIKAECSCTPIQHPVTSSVLNSACSISPLGTTQVNQGSNQSFTFSASGARCSVSNVIVDGQPLVSKTSPYTFTNVQAPHTIAVDCYCAPPEYTITSSSTNPSTCQISPMGTITVVEHNSRTFHYNPNGQFCVVNSVKVDGQTAFGVPNYILGGFDYTFNDVVANHTIEIGCDCTPPSYPIDASTSGPSCTISNPGVTQHVYGSSETYAFSSTSQTCEVTSLKIDGVSQTCAEVYASFTPAQGIVSGGTGTIHKYHMEYRKQQKSARVFVETNVEATGFTLAVNDGPNPKGYGGEMALFYFDCTNNFNPRVTVYTYNGENAASSYLRYKSGATTPDFIVSSVNNVGPGKVFSDIQCGITSNGRRQYRMDIADGSVIMNFVPSYTSSTQVWTGFAFSNLHGVWLHGYNNLNSAYNSNNRITNWSSSSQSWLDLSNEPATVLKDCTSPYTFSNIVASHTIQATCACEPTFPAPTYLVVSSLLSANCTITPMGNYVYNAGATASYTFGGVTSNCTATSLQVDGSAVNLSSGQTTYSFPSISADHTIAVGCTCTFPPPPPPPTYTITAGTLTSNCAITPGTSVVNQGDSKTFTFSGVNGCSVSTVQIDGSNLATVPSSGTYTFTSVQADRSIHVGCTCPPPPKYTITASTTGESCRINPSGAVSVNQYASQEFLITSVAVSGKTCSLVSLTVDGVVKTNINDYDCQEGTRFSFDNVVADHTIVANCQCTQNPVYKKIVLNISGGCRTSPSTSPSSYLQGTSVNVSILPPISTGQCVVDYVKVNSVTQSSSSFALVMDTDKTIQASCSCDYSVTITNNQCTTDWTGIKWFNQGESTCITVGVSDPAHCKVKSIVVDGVTQTTLNQQINFSNLNANHNVVANCECKYNVVPNSPTCNISPSTTQSVIKGGSVTFTVTPKASNCWITSIMRDFISVGNTNSVQTLTNIIKDTVFEAFCECEDSCPKEPPSGGYGCETAFAWEQVVSGKCRTLDSFLNTSRWGWEHYVNRSVRKTGSWTMYAGAGQNDITKGTNVGTFTFNYNSASQIVCTYTARTGFVYSETHLYVGYTPLKNSAPGQYGNQSTGDKTSVEYKITVNGSPVYIVAHAVSCGNHDGKQ